MELSRFEVHDVHRDGCVFGRTGAPDSMGHYLVCVPLRLLVSVFVASSPVDAAAAFHAYGPRDECPDTTGGLRRSVMAIVAYHRLVAHRERHPLATPSGSDGRRSLGWRLLLCHFGCIPRAVARTCPRATPCAQPPSQGRQRAA